MNGDAGFMAMELGFVYRHIAAFLLPLWTCRHHGFTGTNYHKQNRQCHMEVCIKSSAGPVFQWKQPAFTWPTKRLRSMVENCFVSWDILRAWSFHFKLHVAEGGLTVGMMSCTNRFFKSHLESSRRICFGEAKLRAIIIHIYIHDLQSPVLLCFVGHPSLHYLVNLFAFLSTQICFSLQFLHLNINIHIH